MSAGLRSMTGFAEQSGQTGGVSWSWSLRSVNAKGLDLKLRLPPGFEAAEPAIRRHDHGLVRGTVAATLKVERDTAEAGLRVDEDALAAIAAAVERVREAIDTDKPRPEAILALGGVLKAGPESTQPNDAEVEAVVAGFVSAAARLGEARAREGAALQDVLNAQLDRIEALTAEAASEAEAATKALRARLLEQIGGLIGDKLPEERLAQEAALLAVKADIREELDRLRAHAEGGRALLAEGRGVGRKLEFLVQELAREANTLTAKAPVMSLKTIGLDLKHVVDQVREQVLNVE